MSSSSKILPNVIWRCPQNSLNVMTIKKELPSKGFDPRVSSVEGRYATHYPMEPSATAIIFKPALGFASLELSPNGTGIH